MLHSRQVFEPGLPLLFRGLCDVRTRNWEYIDLVRVGSHGFDCCSSALSQVEGWKNTGYGLPGMRHYSPTLQANAAFQTTRNPCFSNLLPVKVHWNGNHTCDFPPVNSY
ncbi:hypothetical protein DPX16_10526 [Anabarilius grahami]|uniref:Uncharacterized protein n=1 Tax=Anabarilius grahami TaxID=495550 RepID=A0A3N0Z6Z7_ANAGA|nr:hypothetical protein DPX16_10526 [Anabarilius grahami]